MREAVNEDEKDERRMRRDGSEEDKWWMRMRNDELNRWEGINKRISRDEFEEDEKCDWGWMGRFEKMNV